MYVGFGQEILIQVKTQTMKYVLRTAVCQTSGNVFLNRIPLCHTLDIQHVIVFPAGSSDVLGHS